MDIYMPSRGASRPPYRGVLGGGRSPTLSEQRKELKIVKRTERRFGRDILLTTRRGTVLDVHP